MLLDELNFNGNITLKQQDLLNACRNSILNLMRERNIHISQLAREVNVPQPTMHRLLKGKSGDIKLSTLIEIANFFSVTLADITNYAPPCAISKADSFLACRHVPILTWREACNASQPVLNDQREYICAGAKCSHSTFALKTKASFNFIFPKDTILIIDPEIEAADGDYVVLSYQETHEATMRLLVIDGPVAELKKINCEDKAEPLTKETTIIGPVLQSMMVHKKMQTNVKIAGAYYV